MVHKVQYFSEIWRESDEAKIYVNGTYSFAVGGNQTVDGCYLTTACVQHRGLADDCTELTILRHSRDSYMKASVEGAELIQQYYKTAPQLVVIIKNHPNRSEIFEFIYQNLVRTSIKLIEQNQKALAMEYYAAFTLALEQRI